MVDAIVRTLARLYVTRRNLLEWTTAAQAKASHDLDLAGFYRQMAGGVAIAAVSRRPRPRPEAERGLDRRAVRRPVAALARRRPVGQHAARRIGRRAALGRRRRRAPPDRPPRPGGSSRPSSVPRTMGCRPTTSRTIPRPVVAHRTSPTNIGMYLLATVTARDFGWIGTLEMVERLEATLATIGQPRAIPRAPVQLVRHARPAPARAGLRVVGRQRQPRRPPARPVQRLPPDDRPAAAGRGRAGRDR